MRLILRLLRTCEDEVESCGHGVWHIRVGILTEGMLTNANEIRTIRLIAW